MEIGTKPSILNWRVGLIVLAGVILIGWVAWTIIQGITYPVVPARILIPAEARVILTTSLEPTDQGLVALVRQLKAIQREKAGAGGAIRDFLGRVSGQPDLEESLPIVQAMSFAKDPAATAGTVLVAYSLSHSVKPIRWNFGCAPAPKGGKKLSYRGESLFVVSHEGETYVDTMVENTRIVGTNEDAVKRVVDKLSEKKTTLDVPGELGKLYEEFAGKYPIVAVAANDRGEVAAFLNQMKPKDSADPMVAVKEYLGFDPEGIRMLAAGAKVISADRIEAGGVAFCADAPTAAALAEAINKNVQRPGGPGTWSFKTTATATDDRVDVQFELIGVKELALEQIAAAEEAAKKAATPSPATPKETPTAAGPAPSPATAETPKSDAPGR